MGTYCNRCGRKVRSAQPLGKCECGDGYCNQCIEELERGCRGDMPDNLLEAICAGNFSKTIRSALVKWANASYICRHCGTDPLAWEPESEPDE